MLKKLIPGILLAGASAVVLSGCAGAGGALLGAALLSQAPRVFNLNNNGSCDDLGNERVLSVDSNLTVLGSHFNLTHNVRGRNGATESIRQSGQLSSEIARHHASSGGHTLQSDTQGTYIRNMFEHNPIPSISALLRRYANSGDSSSVNMQIQFSGQLQKRGRGYELTGVLSGIKNQQSFRENIRMGVHDLQELPRAYNSFFYR